MFVIGADVKERPLRDVVDVSPWLVPVMEEDLEGPSVDEELGELVKDVSGRDAELSVHDL